MTSINCRKLLFEMMMIRRMEELSLELYTKEKIRGFLHLYVGQEALVTGVMSLLRKEDNVMATYREHAHALLKGVPLSSIMAEMFGKSQGCSKGRGGSMHLFSKEHRFFGGNAIVGAGLPQAVGLAFASLSQNVKRNTVVFFGEGAVAEGIFHESLNLASLWNIPVIFICENNLYAMGTSLERSQAQTELTKKAQVHNVISQAGDGMDVFDVIEKTRQALSYVEEKKRPYFLEFKTYRFRPHSMFDPELYRSKKEIESWKKSDPILKLRVHLLDREMITEVEIKKMEDDIELLMQEAVLFADKSPLEPVTDLEKNLYEDVL